MSKKHEEKIDKRYLDTEVAKIHDGDLDLVMKNKEAIDKKLQGAGLKKYLELGRIMLGMLKDFRDGQYRAIPWFTIASAVVTLLYVLNPLDMMPDFLPGVGYVDDFAIFTVLLRFIQTDLHAYLDWKLERVNG